MIHVRHFSATGRLDEGWELHDGRILASVRQGSSVLLLDFAICSYGLPIFGAHPVMRVSSEIWAVHPVRFVREWPGGVPSLKAISCPVGDVIRDQIILTNCPQSVCEAMEIL